jgi:hypothetical protein
MEAQSGFTMDIGVIIKGGLKGWLERVKVPKQVLRVYDNASDSS